MDLGKSKEDKKYDEFRLQIIVDSNCNLACEYCVLLYKNQKYKEDRSISYEVIDKYIEFIINNYDKILEYYRRISITFFWWEPLLSKEKCLYITQKLYSYEKINFVIHTNWVLVSADLINELSKYDKSRYSFIVSIDWWEELMLKYRLKNIWQFENIIKWINLLSENNIRFWFSPSIMKPKAEKLFADYKFLQKLNPTWIIINPVTSIYAYREIESTKEIIKWIKKFFDYLKEELWYPDSDIIEYFWLPLNIGDYKNFLKFWINITWDIDWTVHAMSFAWKWFDEWATYSKDDLKTITLWNVIFNKEQLINNICRYDLYKDKDIWNVAYNQQRKWTLPDWDVQNLLAAMILKYFKEFYLSWNKKRNVS